jgi:hypothetical protein
MTGLKRKRVRGKEFDDFMEAFVQAINEGYPKICIQWEYFTGVDALINTMNIDFILALKYVTAFKTDDINAQNYLTLNEGIVF